MALMPRTARHAPAGLVDHALNRAVAQLPLLEKNADDAAFESVIEKPHECFVTAKIKGATAGLSSSVNDSRQRQP